jgi:hypothetical protein
LGYELSPSPNHEKLTPLRKVAGNFFKSSDFQNVLALAGRSPWPVVDTEKTTIVYDLNDSWVRS